MRTQLAQRLFLLLLCSVACMASEASPGSRLDSTQWSCYKLSENSNEALRTPQPLQLQYQALSGDGNAAFELSRRTMNLNHALSRCWLVIASENGHPIAQYNLWVTLWGSADERDRRRAIFWLDKSAKQGFSFAVKDQKSYGAPIRKLLRSQGK